MTFSFARMTEDDLRMLHQWLEEPHVREFYDREPRTFHEAAAKHRGKILGDEPTEPYIASLDGTPDRLPSDISVRRLSRLCSADSGPARR